MLVCPGNRTKKEICGKPDEPLLPETENLETGLEDVVRMERLGFLNFRAHEESKTPAYLPTTRKDVEPFKTLVFSSKFL